MVWKFTVGIIVYFTTLCQKIETLSYLECVTMFLTNILTMKFCLLLFTGLKVVTVGCVYVHQSTPGSLKVLECNKEAAYSLA